MHTVYAVCEKAIVSHIKRLLWNVWKVRTQFNCGFYYKCDTSRKGPEIGAVATNQLREKKRAAETTSELQLMLTCVDILRSPGPVLFARIWYVAALSICKFTVIVSHSAHYEFPLTIPVGKEPESQASEENGCQGRGSEWPLEDLGTNRAPNLMLFSMKSPENHQVINPSVRLGVLDIASLRAGGTMQVTDRFLAMWRSHLSLGVCWPLLRPMNASRTNRLTVWNKSIYLTL